MKKLMTMLSAVALAFGVQAAGTWHSGTSFETMNEGAFNLDAGEGLMWQTNGTPTLEVVDISTAPYGDGIRSEYYQNDAGSEVTKSRALSVKTTFGQPVFRTNHVGAVTMGEVFVDTLVKPTICEDDQITLDSSAKIAIWFKEIEDGSGNIVSTNLMVTAGYLLSNGNVVTTNYNCGVYSGADDWQRFTIKSFADIGNGANAPGFVVFRNGVAVSCSAAKGDATGTPLDNLNVQAGLYHKYHELFPSAVQQGQCQTISAVGFDGTGTVDDILFTDDLGEDFVAPFKTLTLAWDENVTGFKYAYNNTPAGAVEETISGKTTSGSVFVDVYNDDTITISEITFKSGYIFDELTIAGTGITVASDDSGFDIDIDTLNGASGLIKSKAYSPNVNVTIGGNATNFFTLADAFTYINTQSGAVSVQMNAASTAEGLAISPALVLNGPNLESMTIDLNGQALTYAGAGYAITTEIPLTITDTATGGSITANEVVTNTAGQLTIDAGTFTGKVAIGGTAEISGGTFTGTVVAESATGFITGGTFAVPPTAYLAKGYGYNGTSNPYVVGLQKYTITYFDDDHEALADVITPTNYVMGANITPSPDPVKAGYSFAGWTWFIDAGEEPVPVTYVAGDTVGNLLLVASWTEDIVTYDITVTNGVNMTVAVITNGVAAGAAGVYTVVSNDSAKVIFTAAENYNIDGARAKTNEYNNISANIAVEAPVATQDSQDPIPPLPAEPTAADVTNAIDSAKFADAAAVKAIINGDPVKYAAFKAWADTVTDGEAAVVAGPHAAVSYQLSPIVESATLFTNEPTLTFTEIKPAAAGSNWDVTVELKDGATPVQLKAARDAFASRVWKGGSLTTMTQCTTEDVTAAAQEGGTKVKLTVTPPGGNSGFIKIKAE